MYMGLKKAYFAPGTYTDNADPTYTGGAEIGAAMSGNMSMNYDDAKGYGNGVQIEAANGATGGTINYTVDHLTDTHKALVFGWTKDSDGELSETDASTPEGGFSFYRVVSNHGKVEYECWHILRCRLHLSAQDMQQREESTQFTGVQVEGPILGVQTSETTIEFRRSKTIVGSGTADASESEAIAWCKAALSIT